MSGINQVSDDFVNELKILACFDPANMSLGIKLRSDMSGSALPGGSAPAQPGPDHRGRWRLSDPFRHDHAGASPTPAGRTPSRIERLWCPERS